MEVILDNIRSSHNVGSIFRTADAAGINKLYLAGVTPGPLDKYGRENKRLTKVSLGAEKSVAWEAAIDTVQLVGQLKQQGYFMVALEQDQRSVPIFAAKIPKQKPGVLVLGSETAGLSPVVLDQADLIVEIPMAGQKESLNVAVAFGIMVYCMGIWT